MGKRIKDRRYCIEKLTDYNPDEKVETWTRTEWCDDKVDILETMFLTMNTRIYDSLEKIEVRRNVDLQEWTKYRNK